MKAAPTALALLAGGTLAASALVACSDPYAHDTPARPQPLVRSGIEPAPRSASDPAPRIDAHPKRTAAAAVHAFCAQWISWDARTFVRQSRRLAALSAPRYARVLLAQAHEPGRAATLRRDGLGNRGRVLSVAPGARATAGRFVCATREQPIAAGRTDVYDLHYRVYLARAERRGSGWAVGSWEPQP